MELSEVMVIVYVLIRVRLHKCSGVLNMVQSLCASLPDSMFSDNTLVA